MRHIFNKIMTKKAHKFSSCGMNWLLKKSLNNIINYYNDNNYDLGIAIHPDRNDLFVSIFLAY